jgi:hypothetical protein
MNTIRHMTNILWIDTFQFIASPFCNIVQWNNYMMRCRNVVWHVISHHNTSHRNMTYRHGLWYNLISYLNVTWHRISWFEVNMTYLSVHVFSSLLFLLFAIPVLISSFLPPCREMSSIWQYLLQWKDEKTRSNGVESLSFMRTNKDSPLSDIDRDTPSISVQKSKQYYN